MLFALHRSNTIAQLNYALEHNYSIEFDVRDSNGFLIIEHDPYCGNGGNGGDDDNILLFEDYIKEIVNSLKQPLLIVNVKSEGIEYKIMDILKKNTITNYFLLDSSFPMTVKLAKGNGDNLSLRISEYEQLTTDLMKLSIKWLWIDCFTKFVLTKELYTIFKKMNYKICIVSPELQGRPQDIEKYREFILNDDIIPDVICTKDPERWTTFSISNPLYKEYSTKDENGRCLKLATLNGNNTIVESCDIGGGGGGGGSEYPNVIIKTTESGYLMMIMPVNDKFMSLNRGNIYQENNMTYQFKSVYNLSSDKLPVNNELTNLSSDKLPVNLSTSKHIEDSVFYFIYNTDNYYHFIYDSIPILYHYQQLKKHCEKDEHKNKIVKSIKLLMSPSSKKYRFVKETLELLDIYEKDIIYHEPNTSYAKIYIGNSLTHDELSEYPPRNEIYKIYSQMIDAADTSASATIKKIYISRRTHIHNDLSNIGTNYTTRRKLMNEDNLVSLLAEKGYKEVFCENMTMIDKIKLFNNATHIVGAIGGGMCNLVFAKKETKVTCIVSPTFLNVNNRFIYSMNHTNINYYTDTSHYCSENSIPLYTRVKMISNDDYDDKREIEGEIIGYENKDDNDNIMYKISVGNKNTTGWNSENKYSQIIASELDFVTLDSGLNSPWIINSLESICC